MAPARKGAPMGESKEPLVAILLADSFTQVREMRAG